MAIARDTENYGRHPQEGSLGMWSGPHGPDGEVLGCSVGCTIEMSDVSPFVGGSDPIPRDDFLRH